MGALSREEKILTLLLGLYAHRVSETMAIISTIHATHCDASTRHGGMNELRIVDVNTNVREFATTCIEKHQITRSKFFAADPRAKTRHVDRQPRQFEIKGMAKNELHKAAAIKAGLRRCATPPIRYAHILAGFRYDIHALR